VAGVLAIFTYGFDKSVQAFEENDCRLETLSNYDALLSEALDIEYITAEQVEELKNWRKNF